MSGTTDPPIAEPSDPRIDLLRRALELSGVALVAGGLALEHYGRADQGKHPGEVSHR